MRSVASISLAMLLASAGISIAQTPVAKERTDIAVRGSATVLRVVQQDGNEAYRLSADGGQSFGALRRLSGEILLRYARFDPLKGGEPQIDAVLRSSADADLGKNLYLVQFRSVLTEAYDRELQRQGAEPCYYVPEEARVVRMDGKTAAKVRALPFVRWVGHWHPAYRLDERLVQAFLFGRELRKRRYDVMLADSRSDHHTLLPFLVGELGAKVENANEGNILVDVTLSKAQLAAVMQRPEVLWIDPGSAPELDMNIVRWFGGADAIEGLGGTGGKHTGKGVRGHIMEGIYPTHKEFPSSTWRSRPIAVRNGNGSTHGNATFGVIFAAGVTATARGLCPDGQGLYTHYAYVYSNSNRLSLNKELTNPLGSYKAMFQTASWGYSRTTSYTTRSAEMDRIILATDLPITQSQSNAGATSNPRMSRPQAWAKNIIAIGGMRHYNDKNPANDSWAKSGSTGPASDGRIKPDLCGYYDGIYTTYSRTGYGSFGGTSGATPINAGHIGLQLELWTDGLFGYPMVAGTWKSRFVNRPHYTVTKAMMINQAYQYKLTQGTRYQQGWGFPNVKNIYDHRKTMLVVNEQDALKTGEGKLYLVFVKSGTPDFRATMTYVDPEANPSATKHRVNDLDLLVEAPDGKRYWGNDGLKTAWVNKANGSKNDLDTVENVFLQKPVAGLYAVSVRAAAVNADTHSETPARDADYGLVVSGIRGNRDSAGAKLAVTTSGKGDMKMSLSGFPSSGWTEGWTFLSLNTARPAGHGSYIGIEWDALSTTILSWPLKTGDPMHFTSQASAAQWPRAPFQFPVGSLSLLKGKSLDAVVVFTNTNGIVDLSNVSRVKL